MTDPIREAAQALASALPDMADACAGMLDHSTQCLVSATDLRVVLAAVDAALSAPQPAADERVAEHMRLVDAAMRYSGAADDFATEATYAAVAASARALLGATGALHTPGVMTMPIRGWRRKSVLPECDDVFTTYPEEAQQWGEQAHVVVDYADHLAAVESSARALLGAGRETLDEVRDMVLHDRGPLEGMGMTNDQTNAVLAIIDAAMQKGTP